jgi:predicted ferric reductase
MENRKAPTFALSIAAIVIGVALFKQIDFQTFKVEKPALSIVYLLTLIFILYVLIKDASRKKSN